MPLNTEDPMAMPTSAIINEIGALSAKIPVLSKIATADARARTRAHIKRRQALRDELDIRIPARG